MIRGVLGVLFQGLVEREYSRNLIFLRRRVHVLNAGHRQSDAWHSARAFTRVSGGLWSSYPRRHVTPELADLCRQKAVD